MSTFWVQMTEAVKAEAPKNVPPLQVRDPRTRTQSCEICGTDMKVQGFHLYTNQKEYSRTWICTNSQCRRSIHEVGMVRYL